ncbi:MAG: DEAD/DEAH box helicase [Planctomycetaceae bacterium]|jgi:superfamily II DNA or RNA helicase|nr:DEAD/DEAH box helicase [Planctomycetaceae bacterium]
MSLPQKTLVSSDFETLTTQFYSLDAIFRNFISIIAIYTAPIKYQVVREIYYSFDNQTNDFNTILEQLKNDGWIEIHDRLITCPKELQEPIVKILVDSNDYDKYARQIYSKLYQNFNNIDGTKTYILNRHESLNDFLRDFRHALLQPTTINIEQLLDYASSHNNKENNNINQLIINYCTKNETKSFFNQTAAKTQIKICQFILNNAVNTLDESLDPFWDTCIQTRLKQNTEKDAEKNSEKKSCPNFAFDILLLDYAFITAKLDDSRLDLINDVFIKSLLSAHRLFFAGSYETSCLKYRLARKIFSSRVSFKLPLPYLSGIFHALSELRAGNRQIVSNMLKNALTEFYSYTVSEYGGNYSGKWKSAWIVIESISKRLEGKPENIKTPNSKNDNNTPKWIVALLCHYEKTWFKLDDEIKYSFVCNSNKTNVFKWITAEFIDLTNENNLQTIINSALLKNFRTKNNSVSLRNLFSYRTNWELTLDALQSVLTLKGGGKITSKESENKSRLVWRIDVDEHNFAEFYPYEQTWDKKTQSWTSDKSIVLSRLFRSQNKLDYLTQQDREICSAIYVNTTTHKSPEYYLTVDVAEKFVGHPLLFLYGDPAVQVELVRGHGEISTTYQNGRLLVAFSPPLQPNSRYYSLHPQDEESREFFVIREAPARFKVIRLTKQEMQIRKILGENGQVFPKEAELALTAWMSNLAGVIDVKTDASIGFGNIPRTAPNTTLYIYITPHGEGIQVEFFVKPLGNDSVARRPGIGSERIIAEVDGQNLQTLRNLASEIELQNKFITKITSLQSAASLSKDKYIFDTPSEALTFLSEVKELERIQNPDSINVTKKRDKKKNLPEGAIDFEIYWTQGEKFVVSSTASFNNMNLSFATTNDWLSAEGSICVDGQSIELRHILDVLDDFVDDRFVKLDERNFLVLTNELRKRLGELKRLSLLQDGKIQMHQLVAAGMDDFFSSIPTMDRNTIWQNIKERIAESNDYRALLPEGFIGELRDYQMDGYAWLSSCARWGVGCCLADDMGLGKTVQALALLLSRAELGAALVVAPTSVCFNWEREAERFTPTLNIKRIRPISSLDFGKRKRDKLIVSGASGDVLVTSYSLLQQEIDLFTKARYATVILDESQAIKNPDSQRARAALRLRSDFKVGITGTPVENNLLELWSLFRFLNPGLLGTQKTFEERFVTPIQRGGSTAARTTLRRLLRPFILRRTKSQVLEELPPRTEIIREIELSREEMTLYETERIKALEELREFKGNLGRGQLQVLSVLTKLRQICCHPKLVLPDCGVASSKLEVFREIMLELCENRHKVLVFSQFVKHLNILRDELDVLGISYQYLDGSTPERERQKCVDKFQAGKSDAFLISIKAGGSGLNLTMADYVIHTDPWWNPAVEDQATNRAHRIGQKRPVTVYRLITKGTIEEKIVKLHQEKRDLADKLLEGSNQINKISVDDLINIIMA